jgi:hypothetical protein
MRCVQQRQIWRNHEFHALKRSGLCKEGRRNLHLTTNSPSFHAMFLSLCIGTGMHSQGTLCFALLLLMSVSLCTYIYCISHSCPLHSLTLSWYNLFIGSSDSAEVAPPQTVSASVFSFSQALSGLSLPEL